MIVALVAEDRLQLQEVPVRVEHSLSGKYLRQLVVLVEKRGRKPKGESKGKAVMVEGSDRGEGKESQALPLEYLKCAGYS